MFKTQNFSKNFLYNLGVLALFAFAIFFVYAVLKGSGESLHQMLGTSNIIEGMGNKQRQEYIDKMEKKYEKLNSKIEKELGNEKTKPLIDAMMDKDEIEGFEDAKGYTLKTLKFTLETQFNALIESFAHKGRIDVNSKDYKIRRDDILKTNEFVKFLENYEGIDSSEIL